MTDSTGIEVLNECVRAACAAHVQTVAGDDAERIAPCRYPNCSRCGPASAATAAIAMLVECLNVRDPISVAVLNAIKAGTAPHD